jgi:hypothetical protein
MGKRIISIWKIRIEVVIKILMDSYNKYTV